MSKPKDTKKFHVKQKGAGRPFKPVDERVLEELAKLHCTMKEMAAVCAVSVDTLERNYAEIISKGREQGRIALRRLQWRAAERGNVTMMIWLGKQFLDQAEKSEQIIETNDPNAATKEDILKMSQELLKAAKIAAEIK